MHTLITYIRKSRVSLLVLFSVLLLCRPGLSQQSEYERLMPEAEQLYAEGSYALAHNIYVTLDEMPLEKDKARWVDFRVADTLWRSQAATNTSDSSKFDQARQQLDVLARDIIRREEQDIVWAEVQESLGDFYWTRRNNQQWQQAWPYYQKALDWWAGSDEVDRARGRYINIVKRIAQPEWAKKEAYYFYGYHGNILPLEIAENFLKIATSKQDSAHAHYVLAMTLRNYSGTWPQRKRVVEEFEQALKYGKETDWYDDALYYYAYWLMNNGRVIELENNQYTSEPDFIAALNIFRQIVKEFKKGETQYYDQATEQIKNITDPAVNVYVYNVFLPDSLIQFNLNWRNVTNVDFSIYKIDLADNVRFSGKDASSHNWLEYVDLSGSEKVKGWTKKVEDKGDYKPGQENVELDEKLAMGAYILEANASGKKSRQLLLVSNASCVLKTSPSRALVYFCNADDGAPIADAALSLWEKFYSNGNWQWIERKKNTDKNGFCVFDLMDADNNKEIFVGAARGNQQAFSLGNSNNYRGNDQPWKVYAFCDRPAYRPKETVQWKFFARAYEQGEYSTPLKKKIKYQIYDPRNTKIKEEIVGLNSFGSAWGELELTESMPLGEYQVNFYSVETRLRIEGGRSYEDKKEEHIGDAVLFRLEEYKLPEFKVSISTPLENGKKKIFQTGDMIEAQVQADYYFGGPVANADVEVIVYQNQFHHFWYPERDYPWYYKDMQTSNEQYRNYGAGQIIKREQIKTDAQGRAIVKFQSPQSLSGDFEYRIEARVTDASRREITAQDTVKVTRQGYYVYLKNKHNLIKPQDKVEIDIKVLDANSQPYPAQGTIKVTRNYWVEAWIDPDGREIKGQELELLRKKHAAFPPPQTSSGSKDWQLKFRGYEQDEILTRTLKTDEQGEAEFSFVPEREGYYCVNWYSKDNRKNPINAQTTVWAADNKTTELGYRHGGLEIIVDKDTFKSGQTAPVMLSVPSNDRYVLFSVEADDFYSYELLHLNGTVKFIELPITQQHVPNIFLNAVMVSDQQIFMDTKQVVVPAVENFIDVELTSDKEQYQPQESGKFRIKTKDHRGNPVSCELALGVVDESVYYIQSDYALDPREFFYGQKREQHIQTQSTFNQKSYIRLVKGDKDQLVDARYAGNRQVLMNKVGGAGDKYSRLSLDSRLGFEDSGLTDACKSEVAVEEMNGIKKCLSAGSMILPEQKAKEGFEQERFADKDGLSSQGPAAAVQVRSDFRSTIFWQPDIVTDKNGRAEVDVKFADSLTSWKASARALSPINQFGIAYSSVRTKKPLIVRLQAPRFFVVGDLAAVSCVINNNTDEDIVVTPGLKVKGLVVSGLYSGGKVVKAEQRPRKVKANSQERVDWAISVQEAGTAKIQVTAQAGKYADAMEKTYPVYEHGLEKFIARAGKLRADEAVLTLDLPKERRSGSTELRVQLSPSMAVTMLDSLPYLIDYPYGCVEQTMSRFLPAAVCLNTLKDLGLDPDEVRRKIFGGIEPEYAEKTHKKGKQDLNKLNDMIKKGLERLYDFQHSDGGWGWWKEGDSDHFMSAYVVWGLSLAHEARMDVRRNVIERGAAYLEKEIVEEEDNYDIQAWILHALSNYRAVFDKGRAKEFEQKALDNLWKNRDKLNAYTRALLALSAHNFKDKEKALILARNLENGVKIDDTPDTSVIQRGSQKSEEAVIGTAHWGEDGIYRRWSDGGVEATAFALKALVTIDPENKLIEPVSNWLLKNRRGSQWKSTRDTAIVILAFNDYLKQSGELDTDIEYELFVNNKRVARHKITKENIFFAPSNFVIDPELIKDAANEIRIKRLNGKGPLYFSSQAKFFSLEEPITPAGNEIFVQRQYYRLEAKPTLLKGYVYQKTPLNDQGIVKSGERIETVITIEAKNNYEYLVFEDLKPAGFEAVQVKSGEPVYAKELKSAVLESKSLTCVPSPAQQDTDYTGRTRWVYQELRDRKVALFIDKLAEGIWEIRYELRAEVPGKFHALPVTGYAMYVPEIRANGREIRVEVNE
ncbi:MAG: alpha-2-macroglobulin [Candidatus Omnitrophica bacterium]|nr:alpha-2-macroglobulin [Candidatus Omnitrophota bacterium]MBU4479397.1 alpha-2-macroglobulin [Candidatus Omnitrophota bacterium]